MKVGGAVALVLVVVRAGCPGCIGTGARDLGGELLRHLVEAHQRARRIVRALVDVEHVLHGRDKGVFACGGITQYSLRCGFSAFFLARGRPC